MVRKWAFFHRHEVPCRFSRLRIDWVFAALFVVLSCATLAGLDWPLQNPKPSAHFGTAASGGFTTAIGLDAQGSLVRSADDGELSFVHDGRDFHINSLPSTIGTWVAVEHARGMIGLYSQLAPDSAAYYLKKLKKGSILGSTGASGWRKGEGLDFALYDRTAGRWVNPLLLMPSIEDKTAPVIRSAYLLRGGKAWALGETKSLPQGQYTIIVDAVDPVASGSGAAAPYYIRLIVDGVKAAELSLDTAEVKQGSLRLSSTGPRGFPELYAGDGKIILASKLFPRGRSVIQILVRDFAGNERQASWAINLE